MLQRMNELATQAANGTNSKDSDRQAIQDEIDQLTTEIDRVSETTKFNETYLLKGEAGTKTINMKAHDAGLKGTLTDNGNGTATFSMDALNTGDKVSIGGKTYTIGGTDADTAKMIDDAKNALGTGTGKASIKIGGNEFQIDKDGKVYDKDGAALYVESAKDATAPATFDPATSTFTTTDKFNTTATGNAEITNNALTLANLKSLAAVAGKTTTVNSKSVTVMTDTKNAAGGAGADGVDHNDSTIITKTHAYELASKELLAANQIGDTKGSATDSENTCSTCRELNGKVVGMDEEFTPRKLLPPLHPRCKCCVMYVDSKSMAAAYEAEDDELREYTTEEIETYAGKMSEIADKHLDLENSWSGKVVVDDNSGIYGIQWNGDIITRHETAPHILLHEQLHARSVTKYDRKMYKQYENMEEGSVQFAAQEISKKENIQILESQYDHMTEALRNINKVAGLFKNDYDFAMKLISVPLPDRYDWLNNMIYDKMMLSGNIEDYQKVSHWMEALENGKTS